jgi:hypothetical protein
MCRHTFSHFKKVTPVNAEASTGTPHFHSNGHVRSPLCSPQQVNKTVTLPVPQHKKFLGQHNDKWSMFGIFACTTCARASAHSTYSTAISDSVERKFLPRCGMVVDVLVARNVLLTQTFRSAHYAPLIVSKAQLLERSRRRR